MAIDNTPPRLKLIITIAIITVVTLVSLDFVFKSYYGMMTDEAQREKVAPTREKDEQRRAEAAAFANASMPIVQAMDLVGRGGSRPDAITPQPSDDLAPMTGWSKMSKPAPTPAAHNAPPEQAMAGDAGANMTGDGGATALAGDAGAPHAAHDGGARAPAPAPHSAPGHNPGTAPQAPPAP